MEIKRVGTQPSAKGPSDWFTGTVRIDPLFQAPDPARVSGASVTFEPGARTARGTPTRSGKPSSSRQGAAGLSVKADRLRRSGQAMWCGSHLARSTGMGQHRRLR